MEFSWSNAIVQGLVVVFLAAVGSIIYKGLKKSGKNFAGSVRGLYSNPAPETHS